MIWQNPIHSKRSFNDWVGHPDCGFPALAVSLLASNSVASTLPHPLQIIKDRSVVFVKDMTKLDSVINMLRRFAPHTDNAFWIHGRGIKDTIRRSGESKWMEMPIRQAYVECDILLVDDIPELDKTDPNFQDAYEVSNILRDRFARQGKLTFLFGDMDELSKMPSVAQYRALKDLQEN